MEIIYGNTLADRFKADMKQKIDDIRAEGARLPLLSVVLVGNDPASMSYVRGKEKACSSIGMLQRTIRLDENVSLTPHECWLFTYESPRLYSLYATRCYGYVRFHWM